MKTLKSNISSGFTLLELMVVVSIMGILLGLAAPSISGIIAENKLTSIANDYISTLQYARSEAIKRNRQVVVRRVSITGGIGQWQLGWYVFVDVNGDAPGVSTPNSTANGTDITLTNYPAISNAYNATSRPKGNVIKTDASVFNSMVIYAPSGRIRNTSTTGSQTTAGGNLYVCIPGNTTSFRKIAILGTGRPRITKPPTEVWPTGLTCP